MRDRRPFPLLEELNAGGDGIFETPLSAGGGGGEGIHDEFIVELLDCLDERVGTGGGGGVTVDGFLGCKGGGGGGGGGVGGGGHIPD